MSDWGGYGDPPGVTSDVARRRTEAVDFLTWPEQEDVSLRLRPELADALRGLTGPTRDLAWAAWMDAHREEVDDFIDKREASILTAKNGDRPWRRLHTPESARQWAKEREGVPPALHDALHQALRGLRGAERQEARRVWLDQHTGVRR